MATRLEADPMSGAGPNEPFDPEAMVAEIERRTLEGGEDDDQGDEDQDELAARFAGLGLQVVDGPPPRDPSPPREPHPNEPGQDQGEPRRPSGDAGAAPNTEAKPPRKHYRRAAEVNKAIRERAKLPWVEVRLDADGRTIIKVRLGAYVVLLGSEGSGKSSFLLQVGTQWARHHGVFIYFSVELDDEESGGRMVAQQAGVSWEDALSVRLPDQAMDEALELPRFVWMTGEDALLDYLKGTVDDLRKEFPDKIIMVGVDYLQAVDEGNEREERQRVSKVSKRCRKLAKELGVVLIAVSQTSRQNRAPLRDGDAVGSDTTAMGAESSQLERDAYAMLALGGLEERPDKTTKMDLSVGKMRMGKGDRVHTVILEGESGRFSFDGDVRSGAEVRAERAAKDDEQKVRTAKLAIPTLLAAAPEPMFTKAIAKEIEQRLASVSAALRELQADPESSVVRVRWQPPPPPGQKAKRSNGSHPFWDRGRAEAAIAAGTDLEIFPAGFGGNP
jgi:KaiC/GvpD/RAD55 family RecA-like ATPase